MIEQCIEREMIGVSGDERKRVAEGAVEKNDQSVMTTFLRWFVRKDGEHNGRY